jgi:vacuolar-type H+-ATPase subunit C/Vma6
MLDSLSKGLGLDPGILMIGALAILLVIVLVTVTFLGYFRVLLTIAQFAYPIARVKAIGNPFVRPETLQRMRETRNLYEACTAVQEAGAGLVIPENARPEDVDRILDAWYIDEYNALLGTLPDSIKPFFLAYQGVLEVEQLVKAVRMMYSPRGTAGISSLLIPAGCLTPERLRNLDGVSGIRELAARLAGTPYEGVLLAIAPQAEQTPSPFPVENALWKHALEGLNLSRIHVDPSHLSAVAGFLGTFTDATNILTVLRAKQQGIPADVVSGWFIAGGAVYEEWRLAQLFENRGIREIINQLAGTDYYTVLSFALSEAEEPDLSMLEIALDRFLLARVVSLSQVHHLQGGPLIKYAIARRYEVRNLRVLFHSLYEGLSIPDTARFIVTEAAL